MSEDGAKIPTGFRTDLALFVPVLAVGVTFGVHAEPVMGVVLPVVMSTIVVAAASQFAALSVLAAGGGAATAAVAGLLMNARFLPMGFSVGPSLRGGRLARAVQGQAVMDASFALANCGDGRFDPPTLFRASAVQVVGWIGGTVLGVTVGTWLPAPDSLGLDATYPAFFLALLWPELCDARSRLVTALAGATALALMPLAPPGVPVLAAAGAALIGLRAR